MTRNSSTLALDLTFALNKYKQTGDVRELFFIKRFASMIIAGVYN